MENICSNLVGVSFVAHPGEDCPHVHFENGNNGEEKYYRDSWGSEGLLYCYGESCKVLKVASDYVTLKNEEGLMFTITQEQFNCDFLGKKSNN